MENVRKKSRKLLGILLLALMIIGIWFAAWSAEAEAASTPYQTVECHEASSPVKVGKHYYKFTEQWNADKSSWTYKWYVSKKKTSGYKVIFKSDKMSVIITNGSQVYYDKNNKLYRYTISKKKSTALKKLPALKEGVSYKISAVYGKNVYVTKTSENKLRLDTYMYNTSSKKFKLVKENFQIRDQYGKYVVGPEEFRSDTSARPSRLCRLTSSGISKGKRLAMWGHSETYVGGKLYYVKYTDSTMKTASLYRAVAAGTKKTKLGTFTTSEKYGYITIGEITSKSCNVYTGSESYKYTYKTKKKTPLR